MILQKSRELRKNTEHRKKVLEYQQNYFAKKNNEPIVKIWGTGTPRIEFLHVDDLADACYFLLLNYNFITNNKNIINVRINN